MIRWSVGLGLRFGRLVVAAAIGLLGVAVIQLHGSSVDVYPEFEAPAVQIQAEALGLSAQEVEQLITVPLEQDLLNGIPWLQHIRSQSMPGLSAIDLEFEPGTDLYEARQAVQERMTQAKALPNVGTPPVMIQPTSSTSRVAMVALTSKSVSTMEMSVEARWQIRPRLMSIPGVANVSIWGQRDRQLQVQVDPGRLRSHDVSLTQLIETTGNALWVSPLSFVEASTPGTGGFVETPVQRLGVQHVQPISTAEQLAGVSVEGVRGTPLRIGDVADVREDHQPVIGDASVNGASGLMLVVERFPNANTAQVSRDVEEALDAMAPGLPGIEVDPTVFRPTEYLSSALSHLGVAGLIGLVALVAAAGLLMLSWRTAVIVAVTVPLSLITATYVLHLRGETLSMMTVIGLTAALALVVDEAIGDVDEIRRRRLTPDPDDPASLPSMITDVVVARRAPLLFATVIVLLALAPVLVLNDLAKDFATPVVLSFALAVGASLLVALIVTPALAALFLGRGDRKLRTSPVDRWVHRGFDRVAPAVLARTGRVLIASVLLAAVAVVLVVVDGPGDPLPTLKDPNVLVRVQAASGTSVAEMQRISTTVADELATVPGVASTGAHVGRAITSDEVVDVNAAEIWLRIDPGADYAATLDKIAAGAHEYPGLRATVSTYAEDRLAANRIEVNGDLVVRVYGTDFTKLRGAAEDVASLLGTIPGILTPRIQTQATRPTLEIQVDLAAAQRHGLRPGDVRREASTLISGLTVGSLYEEQKVFDVVVWGGPPTRQSVASVRSLLIDTPSGAQVRLGDIARVRVAPNPVVVTHHAVSRSLDVAMTVHGRSVSDVSAEVTSRLRGLAMPYEYRAEVLGDAAARQQAGRALIAISLIAAALIFLLLQAATGSWRGAAILLVTLPLATVGGLFVAPPMNGITSVGVLAALGSVLALTIRQALLLVRRAQEVADADSALAAFTRAARDLAPSVITTALTTAAALAAVAFVGSRAGLEILWPMSITLLCALPTSVAVVLLVLPTLYAAAIPHAHRRPPSATDLETEVL